MLALKLLKPFEILYLPEGERERGIEKEKLNELNSKQILFYVHKVKRSQTNKPVVGQFQLLEIW